MKSFSGIKSLSPSIPNISLNQSKIPPKFDDHIRSVSLNTDAAFSHGKARLATIFLDHHGNIIGISFDQRFASSPFEAELYAINLVCCELTFLQNGLGLL